MPNQIVCIFCGKKADIVKRSEKSFAVCKHCKHETDMDTYQEMLDAWMEKIQ